MKKIIVTGVVSAIAAVSFVGTASAEPAEPNPKACFGQVHKTINTVGALGFNNGGDVVQALGGQGKNDTARGVCGS